MQHLIYGPYIYINYLVERLVCVLVFSFVPLVRLEGGL